jgi:hypothetical protein
VLEAMIYKVKKVAVVSQIILSNRDIVEFQLTKAWETRHPEQKRVDI